MNHILVYLSLLSLSKQCNIFSISAKPGLLFGYTLCHVSNVWIQNLHKHKLVEIDWTVSFCFFLERPCLTECFTLQRHLARTAGRWKDSPWKNSTNELQDELMSVRLREAEAQAELRETRQRLLEVETQVSLSLSLSFSFSFLLTHTLFHSHSLSLSISLLISLTLALILL